MLNTQRAFEQITEPFAIHLAQQVLSADQVIALFESTPRQGYERAHVADATHDKQYAMNILYLQQHGEKTSVADNLSPEWSRLLDGLRSSDFLDWLEAGCGLSLRDLPTDIAVYTYGDGDFISIHKDKPYKAITAILYLNPDWPDGAGGDYEVRRSPDLADPPVRRIAPVCGQLLAFPPADNSWHSVSMIKSGALTRVTVQLEFWLVNDPKRKY